jgi:5'-3' exonuclease
MGVPAFFRWLTVRYPKVVIDALSEDELEGFEQEYKSKMATVDTNEIDLTEDIDVAALNMAT